MLRIVNNSRINYIFLLFLGYSIFKHQKIRYFLNCINFNNHIHDQYQIIPHLLSCFLCSTNIWSNYLQLLTGT
ncbi:hypothetical protein SPHINGO8BC_50455 [Sphingobacterium multivorum]|uniref:Uncharacterized protein n=1 Tax=Sphingobacterium multivorum TaxID=28454 RepID=A0A654BWX1_SPHMU|nr:hypothetical protein SPHINGO8BC_50455 [Sphingobacterium multivorum]